MLRKWLPVNGERECSGRAGQPGLLSQARPFRDGSLTRIEGRRWGDGEKRSRVLPRQSKEQEQKKSGTLASVEARVPAKTG